MRPTDQTKRSTVKTAELQFMLALKDYIDEIVKESLAQKGIEAVGTQIPRVTPPKPGKSVYFIQGEEGGPIKIGIANDPAKRLRELQRTSPATLRILAQMPGDIHTERELHDTFSEWRLHGEWFEPCDGLLEIVDSLSEAAA